MGVLPPRTRRAHPNRETNLLPEALQSIPGARRWIFFPEDARLTAAERQVLFPFTQGGDAMQTLQERDRYQSDGGIMTARLPALIVLSLAAAVVVAWGLKLAFLSGWYLIILVPALAGGALGGAIYGLVGWSHCRNRGLAAVLGLIAGLTGYLGYYHLCMVDILPPGLEWRVDLLPRYIAFRMETDVQHDVGAPDANQANDDPDTFGNWFLFVWELGMVVGFATWFPSSRARHVYYRQLGRWAKREKMLLRPEDVEDFRESLEEDGLADFAATTTAGSDAQTCGNLLLEYATPSSGSLLELPVYASLEGPPRARVWHVFRKDRGSQVRQVKLEIAEVLTLRPLFAGLNQALAEQHEELRGPAPEVAAAVATAESQATELATITPVAEPYRQRVRGKGYVLWANLLGLTPVVYILAGIGLIGGGIYLATQKSMLLGWVGVPVGAAGVVWGIYTAIYCLNVAEMRWTNRRLRHEISQRPGPLVDGRDSEALCVALVPRENFATIKLTMESDVLLMKIDDVAGRILMEGDSDQYRIPAGAIETCLPECFYHAMDSQHQNQLWMIRLVVNTEEGRRELLLGADHTRYTPMTNQGRQQRAEEVCGRINGLRG